MIEKTCPGIENKYLQNTYVKKYSRIYKVLSKQNYKKICAAEVNMIFQFFKKWQKHLTEISPRRYTDRK